MKTFDAVVAVAITLVALFQACPAPPLAAIGIGATEAATLAGGIGGGVAAGEIGSHHHRLRKRDPEAAPQDAGLPPVAEQACRDELHSATVTVSSVGNNGVRFDGVPPACMTLTNVFLGQNTAAQSKPIPMGSASVQYENLTPDELNTLQQALDSKKQQRRALDLDA